MTLIEAFFHWIQPRRSNNHRPRILHPDGIIAVCFIIVGFAMLLGFFKGSSGGLGSILGYASDISVDDVVSITNQERSKSGLSQLRYNSQLSAAAQAKANDMFSKQYWSHTAPDGTEPWDFIVNSGYSYRVAGENLARDFATTPQMVSAWMASPTHRANILHPRYEEIGIAVVNGKLNDIETTLVVQMFGTPRTTQAAQVPSSADSTTTTTTNPTNQPQLDLNPPAPTSAPETTNAPVVGSQESLATPIPEETDDLSSNRDLELPTGQVLQQQDQLSQESPKDQPRGSVLSRIIVPVGTIEPQLLYSPLAIVKAFVLGVILIMIFVLLYDQYITQNRNTVRIVGKNLAHILYFMVVAFLIIYFRGGMVG